jgi:hypothetical protein
MHRPRVNPDRSSSSAARRLVIDVEPLSEARWNRIEAAVFERLDGSALASGGTPAATPRRSTLSVWLAAAAVCGVALWLLGASLASRESSSDQVSRISTGTAASHLALPGVRLDVSPHSAIVVSETGRQSTLIVLDRGEVTCDVEKRHESAPLLVQAGEVRVEVVGTRFRVMRSGDSARVSVMEGLVRVSRSGRTELVAGGESWPKTSHGSPSLAEPAAVAAPPPAPIVEEPPAEAEDASERPARVARPRLATPVEPEPSPAPPPAAKPEAPPAGEPQEQFEAATRLEAKQPAQAIELYRRLEASGGSWAQNALFARGRLHAERGSAAEARRALRQYLQRFPRGPNAEDARMLLDRLD